MALPTEDHPPAARTLVVVGRVLGQVNFRAARPEANTKASLIVSSSLTSHFYQLPEYDAPSEVQVSHQPSEPPFRAAQTIVRILSRLLWAQQVATLLPPSHQQSRRLPGSRIFTGFLRDRELGDDVSAGGGQLLLGLEALEELVAVPPLLVDLLVLRVPPEQDQRIRAR